MTRWFMDDLQVSEYEARHAWRNAFLAIAMGFVIVATAFVTGPLG